ncbi:MAG: sigma-54 dependent transcriptional regulator [Acidobacteriota bacterium]
MRSEDRPRALVVDDDELVARSVTRVLGDRFTSTLARTHAEARQLLATDDDVAILFLDINLPDGNGLDLLREVKESRPDTEIIMMTAFGTVEKAVEAMRLGAYDFLQKPFEDIDLVRLRAQRAVEKRRLALAARFFSAQRDEESSFSEIVGQSPGMRGVFRLVESVAPSPSTVLVEGESGTGKELVARAIHSRSPRHARPFLAINCATIQEGLFESELFGHVRGAFTSATSDKVGLFEAAAGGTLFLDEIGEMPTSIQAKLLRVLQEGEVRRVGSTQTTKVDARIVAATNQDLRSAMRARRFREDLYYRLSVFTITLPPLRARTDDIPLLAYYLTRKHAKRLSREVHGIEPSYLDLLIRHPWPGNVRELENAIERGVLLATDGVLRASSLPESFPRAVSELVPDLGQRRARHASRKRRPPRSIALETVTSRAPRGGGGKLGARPRGPRASSGATSGSWSRSAAWPSEGAQTNSHGGTEVRREHGRARLVAQAPGRLANQPLQAVPRQSATGPALPGQAKMERRTRGTRLPVRFRCACPSLLRASVPPWLTLHGIGSEGNVRLGRLLQHRLRRDLDRGGGAFRSPPLEQEQAIGGHLRDRARGAVLRGVLARLDASLDQDLLALPEHVRLLLGQRAPCHDAVPLRCLLPRTLLRLVALVGREREGEPRAAVAEEAQIGILAEVADQEDLVHRCHGKHLLDPPGARSGPDALPAARRAPSRPSGQRRLTLSSRAHGRSDCIRRPT